MYACPNCGGLTMEVAGTLPVSLRITTRPQLHDTLLDLEETDAHAPSMADDAEARCPSCHQVALVRDWHAAYHEPANLDWNYPAVFVDMARTPPTDKAWQDIRYSETEIGPAFFLASRIALLTLVPLSQGLWQYDIVRVRRPRQGRCRRLAVTEILQRYYAYRDVLTYGGLRIVRDQALAKGSNSRISTVLQEAGCACRTASAGCMVVNVPLGLDLEAVVDGLKTELPALDIRVQSRERLAGR